VDLVAGNPALDRTRACSRVSCPAVALGKRPPTKTGRWIARRSRREDFVQNRVLKSMPNVRGGAAEQLFLLLPSVDMSTPHPEP